jgi:hypothetical protein
MDQINKQFKEFMTARFLAYENQLGRRVSISEFAEAIGPGIYQGDVSYWLKGARVPGLTIVRRLAANPIIGAGVWSASGLIEPAPDSPLLKRTLAAMEKLPPGMQERITEMIENRAREFQQKREEKSSEDDQAGSPSFSFVTA